MKKFFLSLLLTVCTVCNAQTNHMTFKGIPIDGTINSFYKKLQKKGFIFLYQHRYVVELKGEFAKTRDCKIKIERFPDRDQVNLVSVIFPEKKSWGDITESYFSLKNMLAEKYGTPESIEEFSDYPVISDTSKFQKLCDGECHYLSEFYIKNGKIQLTMKRLNRHKAVVVLHYIDKANADETLKKAMDDL